MFQGDVSKMTHAELERDAKSLREWTESWAQSSIPTEKSTLLGVVAALDRVLQQAKPPSIELGSKCRDTVSGFSGTAIARTDSATFDAQQVELIEEKAKPNLAPEVKTGGPTDEPRRAADPV